MAESVPALALTDIRKTYAQAGGGLEVLRGVTLAVQPGQIVALVGPSGAGKSTLLHIAGLLDRPSAGSIRLAGEDCARMSDDRRTALRRTELGFVYQFHHLLPEFSALENIVVPQMIDGVDRRAARGVAGSLLAKVGLADRASHRPARLSGGEQQRVALARALANRPSMLIADEPTGNLDRRTAAAVFDLLVEIVRNRGTAALIATHNPELAERMDRRLVLEDGLIRKS